MSLKMVVASGLTAALVAGSIMVLGTPGPAFRDCPPGTSPPGLGVDPNDLPASVGPWQRDQLAIAAVILNVGAQRGVDSWTQQLGLAVGMKESSLRNLPHGDRVRNDTIGVFQIGPEHGTYDQRMDPAWSAGNFYQRLAAVPGYRDMVPSHAAHKAQRNADPDAYTSLWNDAAQVMAALKPSSAREADPLVARTGYKLGPVQPATQQVADAVGAMFGIRTVHGWRPPTSERYDQEGHPAGLAVDFMTDDIPGGDQVGDRMADYLIQNAEQIGVRYIIWKQRSWTPARGQWRPMADRGSPTQNHMDHVHLSLTADARGVAPPGSTVPTACELSAPAADDDSIPVGPEGWAKPIGVRPGSRSFGMRMHPVYRTLRMHEGQDFGASCGTPIFAASSAVVTFAGRRGGYGHLIILDHGRAADGTAITTRYGHMYASGLRVGVGDRVTAGQLIADVGNDGTSTACHLHFEVRANGTAIDPMAFLAARSVTW